MVAFTERQQKLLLVGILVAVAIGGLLTTFNFWHVVPEGYVGMYYRFGKMSDVISKPGLNFRLPPPITKAIEIHVRPEVDAVEKVTCGARDGTNIIFPRIEVGNTLPEDHAHKVVKKYGKYYDRFLVYKQVEYIVNGICSEYSSHEIAIEKFNILDDKLKEELEQIQKELNTGLVIGFIRIAKPTLPKALAEAYQRQAAERALKKAKEEEFKRIQQENKNEQEKVVGLQDREVIKAQKQNEIVKKKSEIENQIIKDKADAKAYAITKEAKANQLLLTNKYLELKRYEALLNNAKLIIGNDIPKNAFLNSLLNLFNNNTKT